jgi:hypothetical protein
MVFELSNINRRKGDKENVTVLPFTNAVAQNTKSQTGNVPNDWEGSFLDMAVLDHVIITAENYYSFADEGLLQPSIVL